MTPPETTLSSAAIDFLRNLRQGIDGGLDPAAASARAAAGLPGRLREAAARQARRLEGDYAEDEWGFDREFAEQVRPIVEFLYDSYWRVQATGVEHVPARGRAMIVANHAGILPFDAAMMTMAILKEHPLPRWPRFMVLNWAFALPWASSFMHKVGGVPANPYNAATLLEDDHAVMVFPEGVKGAGKPFAERYRLQRFGRGGFVEIALRTRSPIVPVAVVGSEETYPKIGEIPALARLLGAPYFPVTPTFPLLGPLGLLPLPSKWRIEFCEPIDFSGYPPDSADDRRLVFELSEQVRETIQETLYANLVARGSTFV